MKNIYKLIFFFSIFSLAIVRPNFAEDKLDKILESQKARKAYERLKESAHPSPDPELMERAKPNLSPLIQGNDLPEFMNISLIDDEKSESQRMQNESSIAINPKNPNVLIGSAVDYRNNSSTHVYISKDGGKTWINKDLGKVNNTWRSSNDPSVTFDADGVGYLVYGGFGIMKDSLSMSFGENGVFLSKTTDNGETWKTHIPVIIHQGYQSLDSNFEDKYYIQADNSPSSPYFKHLYIPWKRVTPKDSATQIVISKSTDAGETWSVPLPVSERLSGSSEDTTFGQSFPLTTTGPNGEVYLVWNHGVNHAVGFSKSLDGGKTFTTPRMIHKYNIFGETRYLEGQGYRHTLKGKVRAEAYPALVCDITEGPRRGNIYLVWAADNPPNIYFSKSTDKGENWSSPKIVHSDSKNDQFWAWIAIDNTNGDLAVMYFDSRRDPENMLVECFVSYSSDGGDTWIDKPASDIGHDLRKNPFLGNAFAGDYSGCAFHNGYIFPSWVDMRNTEKDITDSDVYTAVINTNAPEAPYDFKANIIAEEPEKLNLTWKNPSKRAFGQPLQSKDYVLRLFRETTLIATLPGGTESYDDKDLEPYKKYNYSIYAVANNDSSIARNTWSYAGGAKEPAQTFVDSYSANSSYQVTFKAIMPSLRADSVTALKNLKSVNVYRNRTFIKKVEVQPGDAGKTIDIIDDAPEKGYFRYVLIAEDEYGNRGIPSPEYIVYSDEIRLPDSKIETFDSQLPKYFVGGKWANYNKNYFSSPNCFANSPSGKYPTFQKDTFMIFPVKTDNKEYYLQFYHAAFVDPNDTAVVEYSIDYGKTWSNVFVNNTAAYDKSMNTLWNDGSLENADFYLQRLQLPITDKNIFLRFRFGANNFKNDLGWFVDNIEIKEGTVGIIDDKTDNEAFLVYPNPAQDYLRIHKLDSEINKSSISISNSLGEIIFQIESDQEETLIDVANYPSGLYFIEIKSDQTYGIKKKLLITK